MRVFSFSFLLAVSLCASVGAASEFSGRITVVDGDTVDVGDRRVRLFGIDAPEQAQTCRSDTRATWACGAWVTREAAKMFDGKRAQCTALDTDRYGRTVARCFVNRQDMARQLVQRGLAFAYRRFSLDYDLDEKGAAVRVEGLHASRVESPEQFRAARGNARPASAAAPASGCEIKGNISGKGVRIYHMPGQRDYARTSIRPENGERWFCSVAEAEASGWRRARR